MKTVGYVCLWLAAALTAAAYGYLVLYLVVSLTVLGATMVWLDRDHPPGGHTP